MNKPLDIVDRDREWAGLQAVWSTRRPELVFFLGRRRVGKSFLLSRFANQVGGLYYQASSRTEPEQLAHLSRAIGDHFDDPALRAGVTFPDWDSLFAYITNRTAGDPFLLVLDEFPYICSAAPAVPSILQSLWDHAWQNTHLKIVLSGSHTTAMRRLEQGDQPLYGRRTHKFALPAFQAHDVGAFVPRYTAEDRMLAYGMVGGLPGHLSLLDPSRDLAGNAAALFLDSTGRLVDDALHMLDAFLADAEVHYSIVDAIAAGEQTWRSITSRIGRSGGSMLRPMEWLIAMQLVRRVAPITERVPAKSKRAVYRISDPYISFWHRFIGPLVADGSVGLVDPQRLWSVRIAPRLADYIGPVFESACREAVRAGIVALPFEPMRVGEWWDARSEEQIDIVADGADGELLVAECKWGSANAGDLQTLERRAQILAEELGGRSRIHLALFSGRGVDRTVRAAAADGRVLVFGLDDVVGAPTPRTRIPESG